MPEVGRFISPDSIVPEPSNPQSFNRYSYVLNSPMNYTDPTGHMVSSGCEYEGCALEEELDPGSTWVASNGSLVLAPPHLLEQYPAEISADEITFAIVGLTTVAVLPAVIEADALMASSPWLASGGSAACADGDCTNEFQAIHTGAHTVYRYVERGVTRYVGITNNFARRAAEHLTQREWNIERIPGLGNLSKSDARAVEQVLIEHYGLENIYNKINSIAASNSNYQEALQRGLEILNQAGIFPWGGP